SVQGIREVRSAERCAATLSRLLSPRDFGDVAENIRSARLLTSEERQRLEPLLRGYETQRAALAKKRFDQLLRWNQRLKAEASKAKIDLSTTEGWTAWRAIAERLEAEGLDHRSAHQRIQDVDLRLVKDVGTIVSFEARREIEQLVFFAQDSGSWIAFWSQSEGIDQKLLLASRLKVIDDPTRGALRALHDRWATIDVKFREELVALVDPGEHPDPKFEAIQEVLTRRRAAAQEIRDDIAKLVPAKAAQVLFDSEGRVEAFDRATIGAEAVPTSPLLNRVASGRSGLSGAADRYRSDWRPRSIDRALVAAWTPDQTKDESATIDEIIEGAKDRWKDAVAMTISAASALAANAASPSSIDVATARIKALVAADVADSTTLDDLAAALPESRRSAIVSARLERSLEIWADGETLLGRFSEFDLLPNLVRVVRTSLAPDRRAESLAKLEEQKIELVDAARTRRTAQCRCEVELEAIEVERRELRKQIDVRPREEQWTPADLEAEKVLSDREQSVRTEQHDARLASSKRFRAIFETTLMLLTEEERLAVGIAYEREAYPERFRDIRSATWFFEQAKALSDNEPDRCARIEAAQREFERERNAWQVAALASIRAHPTSTSQQDHIPYNRVQNRWFFDLAERNMRGVLALRRQLTTEGRAKIPGLDEYERICLRLGKSYWND
ncbi:MAG: hypothetical protein SGJ09_14935, partial [Phycisphaerae bacterium]|nr:hypothetical protein [Phycisphaerae bacterium]